MLSTHVLEHAARPVSPLCNTQISKKKKQKIRKKRSHWAPQPAPVHGDAHQAPTAVQAGEVTFSSSDLAHPQDAFHYRELCKLV